MAKKNLDVTEIAQKQRHLSLLQKVKENKTLTKAELRELKRFEREQSSSMKIEDKLPRRPGRKKKPSGARARLPITEADVRRLALECESLTVAESQANLPGRYSATKSPRRLMEILKIYPQLRKAWDRGRFLRNLRNLARTGASVTEAAKKLGLANGRVLRTMIDEDEEVGDLWDQTQLEVYIEIKSALVNEAKEGNQAAIKAVEKFLLDEKERPGLDPSHVTTLQLTELTGKNRKTILEWHTKKGLPRSADKTYDLGIFLAWFEEFLIKKASAGKGTAAVLDPLRAIRAEKLKVELASHRHDLLDRNEIINSLVAWVQNIVTFCERGAEELSRLCSSQPRVKIAEIARGFFRDLHIEAAKLPKELHLPAAMEKELSEFLKRLKPQ